ncbi:MAG: hypothetical protein COA71_05100 [SAR86 cluster bacterium]|uniref:Lipoprotein n=1 Tax=SAR86 cluster bacterium TaxID=2030880 RepID=A0A2A5CGJ5_9GAMM|nr:MAG: hypothetical protein COA71_05100 [SAR86 cluster bacterium]
MELNLKLQFPCMQSILSKSIFVFMAAVIVAGCSPQASSDLPITEQVTDAAMDNSVAYPDWHGQWHRAAGSLNWPSEGYEQAGPPPLNDEYMAIYEGYTAAQEAGLLAGDPTASCLPQGMPRIMKMVYPMEIIITPEITYIYAEWNAQFRRVYTDGRNWPGYILPAFNGYSIGEWHDEDGDGIFDMLAIETRGLKGPRAFDSTAAPLHPNDQTLVLEELRLTDDMTMQNTITTIDDALTGPWIVNQVYERQLEDIIWAEYACAENNRHLKLGDEWYFINGDGTLAPTRAGQPGLVPDNQN